MQTVALPMFALMRELATYDSLFSFYPDGVHSVVAEAVISSAYDKVNTSDMHPETRRCYGLLGKVICEYELFLDRMESENVASQQLLDEYIDRVKGIELVVDIIDERVRDIMHALFPYGRYTVLAEGQRWIGDDLFVKVRSFSRPVVNINYKATRHATPAPYRPYGSRGRTESI